MDRPALTLTQTSGHTTDTQNPSQTPTARIFLQGLRVGLRALDRADITPRYLGWLQDRDITRHLETGVFPLTLEDLQRYIAQRDSATVSPPNSVFFAIQHLESGLHIGNIKLEPIHWLHRTATLGLLIGETSFQGQGLGEEATRLCLRYAFERLGLHKISLGVLTGNTRAFKLYRRLGFVVEGCRRQEYWIDGAYHDAHIMGLFAVDYNFE